MQDSKFSKDLNIQQPRGDNPLEFIAWVTSVMSLFAKGEDMDADVRSIAGRILDVAEEENGRLIEKLPDM